MYIYMCIYIFLIYTYIRENRSSWSWVMKGQLNRYANVYVLNSPERTIGYEMWVCVHHTPREAEHKRQVLQESGRRWAQGYSILIGITTKRYFNQKPRLGIQYKEGLIISLSRKPRREIDEWFLHSSSLYGSLLCARHLEIEQNRLHLAFISLQTPFMGRQISNNPTDKWQNYSCMNAMKDMFVLLWDPTGEGTCLGKVLPTDRRWQRKRQELPSMACQDRYLGSIGGGGQGQNWGVPGRETVLYVDPLGNGG